MVLRDKIMIRHNKIKKVKYFNKKLFMESYIVADERLTCHHRRAQDFVPRAEHIFVQPY